MDRTPVRDGVPLWAVDVRVISTDPGLWERWECAYDLQHPALEKVRGYGVGELPDDRPIYSTELRIWAAGEGEALAIADALVSELLGPSSGHALAPARPDPRGPPDRVVHRSL